MLLLVLAAQPFTLAAVWCTQSRTYSGQESSSVITGGLPSERLLLHRHCQTKYKLVIPAKVYVGQRVTAKGDGSDSG